MKAASILLLLCPLLPFIATPAAAPQTDTSINDMAWMAGTWTGVERGIETEEHWLEPKGGLMLGLHRDVFPGGRTAFEFLRIQADDDGIAYWASPGGREPTPFRLVESSERRVVFENAEHDWPQRIIYWLEEENVLGARAEGTEGGELRALEWRWQRH